MRRNGYQTLAPIKKKFSQTILSFKNPKDSSFLQETTQRIKGVKNLENPIIICNEEHRFIAAEQLRLINIKPSSIILEPSSQNTAPAITAAALRSVANGDDPILLILPSDHKIENDKIFLDYIEMAKEAAIEGNIVTLE